MKWILLLLGFVIILSIRANKEVIVEYLADALYQWLYKE